MNEEIQYPHAPALEAVFELTFEREKLFSPSDFDTFFYAIRNDFPEKRQFITQALNFKIGPKSDTSQIQSTHRIGYRFFSHDQKDVIHLSDGTFAYSRLKPYLGWPHAFGSF